MINSITMKNLRGIQDGGLDKLSPLTILVGPNGCGKSTVLDALLIGAAAGNAATAVTIVLSRNPAFASGVRWLIWRGLPELNSVIKTISKGRERVVTLRLQANTSGGIHVHVSPLQPQEHAAQGMAAYNPGYPAQVPRLGRSDPAIWVSEVRLIDSMSRDVGIPLHDLYTRAVEADNRDLALRIVSDILPSVRGVEILTENSQPVLHINFNNRTVPASQCGDGTRLLLRTALEMASQPDGVVLLEEPEAHLHPRSIRQCAQVMVATVRRGIQVIATTHSLELIDAVVDACQPDELCQVALHRLQQMDGKLKSSRLDGSEIRFARQQIEDDLR